MKTINDNNTKELPDNNKYVVIFGATWCQHCGPMKQLLEKIEDVESFYCNVDESPDFTTKNNVMALPTIIVYNNGEEINRLIGTKTYDELKSIC